MKRKRLNIILISCVVAIIVTPILIYFLYHFYTTYKILSAIDQYNNSLEAKCNILYIRPGYFNLDNPPGSSTHYAKIYCDSKEGELVLRLTYVNNEMKLDHYNAYIDDWYEYSCGNQNCFKKKNREKIICINEEIEIYIHFYGAINNIEKEICLFQELYD
jgi:hypothetical protein